MRWVFLLYVILGAVLAVGGDAEPFDLEALNCGGKYAVIRGANVGKSIGCPFTPLNTEFFSGHRDGQMICVDGCFEDKADAVGEEDTKSRWCLIAETVTVDRAEPEHTIRCWDGRTFG
jgi:hypothetical protein